MRFTVQRIYNGYILKFQGYGGYRYKLFVSSTAEVKLLVCQLISAKSLAEVRSFTEPYRHDDRFPEDQDAPQEKDS